MPVTMQRMDKRAMECPLNEPKAGGSVWPTQFCPAFTPRRSAPAERECWGCKYADFHLMKPVALEVGVCRWPKAQLD